MTLSPSERELELEAGKTYESSVRISNTGRLPFDVKASVSPYYVSGDDYSPDFDTTSSYAKLANWVKLEKEEYHLEPGESEIVNFTVDVPKDVVSGGQYAAIMLLSDSGIEDDSAVKVQSQLAAIIYGHIDGADVHAEGKLLEHSLPGFMFDPNISATQTVENTGNIDFRVRHTMTVTDFFTNQDVVTADSFSSDGQMIGHNTAVVLPNTTRTGILAWNEAPRLGLFKVTQEISFLNQEYEFSQLVFICPIWLIAIVVVAVIGIIFWLIYRTKTRKNAKAQLDQ